MDKRLNFPNGEIGITNDEIDLMPNSNQNALHGIGDGIGEGVNYIVSGVNAVVNNGINVVVQDGYVFLNGEMLKVDAATIPSTIGDLYEFQKVTVNNVAGWDRNYRDATTHNVYQKNRAVPVNVASVTSLGVNGSTMTDVLKTLIRVQSDWNQSDTQAPDYVKNKPSVVSLLLQGRVNGIDVAGPGNISLQGAFTSFTILTEGGGDYRLRLNFPNVGTSNYHPIITPVSKKANFDLDNDTFFMVRDITSTSIDIIGKEQVDNTQDIDIIVTFIPLDLT